MLTVTVFAAYVPLSLASNGFVHLQDGPQMLVNNGDIPSLIGFGEEWSVLGPFQTGTREAPWGADPLEYYGGFSTLSHNTNLTFKSSLVPNGTLTWSAIRTISTPNDRGGCKICLCVDFPHVDWASLQAIYGWSALQWQGWARGELFVTSKTHVSALLYTDHVLEYALDGQHHFGGDLYGFRKSPLVVHLTPGRHTLDIRLVRDVRSMSAAGSASVDVEIELVPTHDAVEAIGGSVVVSDIVDAVLPSPYASVDVRNNGAEWIEVFDVMILQTVPPALTAFLYGSQLRTVAPGQTRPIIFLLRSADDSPLLHTEIGLKLSYRPCRDRNRINSVQVSVKLRHKSHHQPQKVTHIHPSGIVSYSMLRPPPENATCQEYDGSAKAPVMLQLHGAGVETDSDMVYSEFDSLPLLCAWVVFPSGVTPWSGDDWHIWGFADVLASISGIANWVNSVGWQGPDLDGQKWLVAGHSNGGQGAWYALLHYPDNVFAAAPLSGYLSIHEYVPYKFWRPIEPRKRAIIEAALNNYRAEYLVSNAKGIPIQQQHGGADDNVPPYHSRFMTELLSESGWVSNYNEEAGMPHWWDGAVATPVLTAFYEEQIDKAYLKREVPPTFELIVANPTDMGSKFGLKVLALVSFGELGRITATFNQSSQQWDLDTFNIQSFQWNQKFCPSPVTIDGQPVFLGGELDQGSTSTIQIWKTAADQWTVTKGTGSKVRPLAMLGGLDAILRSNGTFSIIYHGDTFATALEVARNLHQYYYADVEIRGSSDLNVTWPTIGNQITIGIGEEFFNHFCTDEYTTQPCASDTGKGSHAFVASLEHQLSKKLLSGIANRSEVGAIFLHPQGLRLGLVIWGSNAALLQQMARLTPTITGVGQPGWIVCGKNAAWKGADGCDVGFLG